MNNGKPVPQPFSDILKSLADIDANSGGPGAVGAVPVFDGAKFVWSAMVSSGVGDMVVGSTFIVG